MLNVPIVNHHRTPERNPDQSKQTNKMHQRFHIVGHEERAENQLSVDPLMARRA